MWFVVEELLLCTKSNLHVMLIFRENAARSDHSSSCNWPRPIGILSLEMHANRNILETIYTDSFDKWARKLASLALSSELPLQLIFSNELNHDILPLIQSLFPWLDAQPRPSFVAKFQWCLQVNNQLLYSKTNFFFRKTKDGKYINFNPSTINWMPSHTVWHKPWSAAWAHIHF